jgi:hypothetical protein
LTRVHYLLRISRSLRTDHLFRIDNTLFLLIVHHILLLLLLKCSFIKLAIFMRLLLLLRPTSICLDPLRSRTLRELILIMHPIIIHIHLLNILRHVLLLLWHGLTTLIVTSIRTNIISSWSVDIWIILINILLPLAVNLLIQIR